MSEENVNPDDARLEWAQELRHDLVVNLTTDQAGSRSLPRDSETLNTIKGLLKDSDGSIFTKRRLSNDEASLENDKLAASLLEKVADKLSFNPRDGSIDAELVGPDLSGELPEFDIPETMTSQLGDQVDLDAINREGRRIRKGMED